MLNADVIDQLQEDKNAPSHDEINMVNTLFKKERSTIQKIFNEVKTVIFVALLYIALSIPYVDTLIQKVIPITQTSWMILILIKAVVFMFIFYFLNNMYFAKSK
jgi:hypothetical protein